MKPTIKFEAVSEDGRPLARELVCTVWSFDAVGEQSISEDPVVNQRSVLIGSSASEPGQSEVELPSSGTYLVDLGFPNGRRTRRSVTVSATEPYRFLVQEKRYAASSLAEKSVSTSFLKDAPRVLISAARSVLSHSELEVRLLCSDAPVTSGLRGLRAFLKNLEMVGSNAAMLKHDRVAGLADSVELNSSPEGTDSQILDPSYRRSWLLVNGQGRDTTVVPYPSGWTSAAEEKPFLLSVRRKQTSGDEATKWSVSLQMRDASNGSLIEYLTRRDLSSSAIVARTIRNTAVGNLYEKNLNPFLAAAGAYMLAMGEHVQTDEALWMTNLTKRFPWLPDGPIAEGYRLLSRSKNGSPDFNTGRNLIFEASDRGLPYFSVGLSLLTEALTFIVLAEPSNALAKAHSAAAIAAELACVRNEAFCTLQTSRFYRLPQATEPGINLD